MVYKPTCNWGAHPVLQLLASGGIIWIIAILQTKLGKWAYFTATYISAFYHRFVGAPTTGTALVSSKVGLRYHRATVAVVISQFAAVIITVPGLFLVDIS